MKTLNNILQQDELFRTARLAVLHWNFIETQVQSDHELKEVVLSTLTKNVTKSLPVGWQELDTIDKADKWLSDRKRDSDFYAITLKATQEIIGFLFLYPDEQSRDLRLGYLLSESVWGEGIGSELIQQLVLWCKNSTVVNSLSGGVEPDNMRSIAVLEKNGFKRKEEQLGEGTFLYQIDFK